MAASPPGTSYMSGPVFVDTNVFVYQSDASDSEKQARADDWCATLWHSRSGRVSVQVLLELYATLTRKLKTGIDPSEAREIVGEISAWRPIPVDLSVIRRAWSLEHRYSLSWWDSLIVAAAQVAQCTVLLTEDLQHGELFDAVRVVNPFVAPDRAPEEILRALEH